jgi:hypothetical protein
LTPRYFLLDRHEVLQSLRFPHDKNQKRLRMPKMQNQNTGHFRNPATAQKQRASNPRLRLGRERRKPRKSHAGMPRMRKQRSIPLVHVNIRRTRRHQKRSHNRTLQMHKMLLQLDQELITHTTKARTVSRRFRPLI